MEAEDDPRTTVLESEEDEDGELKDDEMASPVAGGDVEDISDQEMEYEDEGEHEIEEGEEMEEGEDGEIEDDEPEGTGDLEQVSDEEGEIENEKTSEPSPVHARSNRESSKVVKGRLEIPVRNDIKKENMVSVHKISKDSLDEDGELDFEPEEVNEERKEDGDDNDKSREEEDGENKDKDDDNEEGEIDDDKKDDGEEGEIKDDDDLEEGEVKELSTFRRPSAPTYPICKFYTRGNCTWGDNCRFIHPGCTTQTNYSSYNDQPKPLAPTNRHGSNQPPRGGGYVSFGNNRSNEYYTPPYVPPPPPPPPAPREQPAAESAWERGMRQAKEMKRKSQKRKEQEPDFEEKRLNMTLGGDPELEKENEVHTKSPYRRNSDSFSYSYDDNAMDPYERQAHEYWRGGNYENFEVRYTRPDFKQPRPRTREHEMKVRPRDPRERGRERERPRKEDYTIGYDRGEKVPAQHRWRDNRYAEVNTVRTRGDEWNDPWRRSITPKVRGRTRSYSTGSSSYSSTGSSRSSSGSSRSRSSSASSYSSYTSRSYSRSGSGSRSPGPGGGGRRGRDQQIPSPTSVTIPVVRPKKKMPPQSHTPVEGSPPPAKAVTQPPPSYHPPSTKKPRKPDRPERPTPAAVPPARGARIPSKSRSKSGSLSSRSRSRSHSSQSSHTPSHSMSRSPSHSASRSASRSRSSSISSISSVTSGSSHSSGHASQVKSKKSGKKSRQPVVEEGIPPTQHPHRVRHMKKTDSMDDMRALQANAIKASKDPLKQSGQKQQIKLTLLNKPAADKPSATKEPQELKQKPAERVDPSKPLPARAGVPSRKRPASPSGITSAKIQLAVSSKSSLEEMQEALLPMLKKSTSSRREELLKQLKAVEDAIARKRSKLA